MKKKTLYRFKGNNNANNLASKNLHFLSLVGLLHLQWIQLLRYNVSISCDSQNCIQFA
jgi:hypothetical protein